MGILERKKYDVFGVVLVPMEFGEPQQIGFRIPNRGPCPSKGPGAHVRGEYHGVCCQLCELGGHRTPLGLCFLTWE